MGSTVRSKTYSNFNTYGQAEFGLNIVVSKVSINKPESKTITTIQARHSKVGMKKFYNSR